jgi:hypothetical protein
LIRLFKYTNTGEFKDFQSFLFSASGPSFDFPNDKVTVSAVEYRISNMMDTSTSSSVNFSYITDATTIAIITDPANWDGDGMYTGSTAMLIAGNVYLDSSEKLRYEFDGTRLVRNPINNVI